MKNKKDKMSALISMDLNGLKTINDTMGHQAGDEAIIAAAKSFTSVKGYKYKVYRVGGDEFNAIILNATEDNIKEIISNMNEYANKLGYSISFGYSMNDKNYSIDELIKYADSDMYNSKKEYYEEINNNPPVQRVVFRLRYKRLLLHRTLKGHVKSLTTVFHTGSRYIKRLFLLGSFEWVFILL